MASAIGVISGVITIFSFITDLFPTPDSNSVKFRFKLGNDGTRGPNGGQLVNAGGAKPDIRVWSPVGDFLGIKVNDGNKCVDGDTVCDSKIGGVRRAPEYAVFSANNDAICIAVAQTTYPSGENYAMTIGNWAEECAERHGVSQATWFYSNVFVRRENGAGYRAKCSWIDRDGDQPSTGIQIHWPEFDTKDYRRRGTNYYCNSRKTLHWYTSPDPSGVVVYKNKRDVFASEPSIESEPSLAEFEAADDREVGAVVKRGSSEQFANELIKSFLPDQSASELCNAKASAGPSFVSHEERAFCFMPTKTLFPFCEDVALGLCWSEDLQLVTPKLVDFLAPDMNFTNIAVWDEGNANIFG